MKVGRIARGGGAATSAASAAEAGGADGGGEGGKKRGWAAIDDDDAGEFAVGGWRIAQVSDVYVFMLYFLYYNRRLHVCSPVGASRAQIPRNHTGVSYVCVVGGSQCMQHICGRQWRRKEKRRKERRASSGWLPSLSACHTRSCSQHCRFSELLSHGTRP